jgi:hypothetical protein
LSEQLLAALTEKEALVTATVELNSSKAFEALETLVGRGCSGRRPGGARGLPTTAQESPPAPALVAARASTSRRPR